jgi:hypothetical protein
LAQWQSRLYLGLPQWVQELLEWGFAVEERESQVINTTRKSEIYSQGGGGEWSVDGKLLRGQVILTS